MRVLSGLCDGQLGRLRTRRYKHWPRPPDHARRWPARPVRYSAGPPGLGGCDCCIQGKGGSGVLYICLPSRGREVDQLGPDGPADMSAWPTWPECGRCGPNDPCILASAQTTRHGRDGSVGCSVSFQTAETGASIALATTACGLTCFTGSSATIASPRPTSRPAGSRQCSRLSSVLRTLSLRHELSCFGALCSIAVHFTE